VLVVAVDHKTVLSANHAATHFPKLNWNSSEPRGQKSANGQITYGDWMDLRADQIIDLDVLIGESPGGGFGAFLLVQQKGATYSSDAEGYPILPIFQVAPHDTPTSAQAPEFAQGFPIWKSYQ